MTLQIEGRLFSGLQLRAQTETVNGYTFLHGRAVPYDVPTSIGYFMETHEPGSLAKSIKEAARALPLLIFHDSRTWPVGVADTWEDTPTGLDGIWKLDQSEEAQRAAQLADDGLLTGMSIGFVPIRSRWEFIDDREWNPSLGPEHMDTVYREESRLMEVSLTPTPAFKDAAVSLVRSFDNKRRTMPDGSLPTPRAAAWRDQLAKLRTK